LGAEEVHIVVDLIFQTISLYEESKRSQRDVEKAISSISKLNADFASEFFKRIEKAANAKPPLLLSTTFSIRNLLTLLRWSFALTSSDTTLPLNRLVSVQGALIEALASSGKAAHLRTASSLFKRYLRASPNVAPLLIEHFVTNQSSRSHPAIALIGSFSAKHRFDLFQANRVTRYNPTHLFVANIFTSKSKFLEGYVQAVLSANSKQERGYLEWFAAILKKVEKNEFGNVLLPAIVRLLKRTPEVAIHGISYLLEVISTPSSTADLSDFAVELSTNLIPHIKSADEHLRAATLTAYSYLIKNISKSKTNSAVGSLLQQLVALIGLYLLS